MDTDDKTPTLAPIPYECYCGRRAPLGERFCDICRGEIETQNPRVLEKSEVASRNTEVVLKHKTTVTFEYQDRVALRDALRHISDISKRESDLGCAGGNAYSYRYFIDASTEAPPEVDEEDE